jgi:exosortase
MRRIHLLFIDHVTAPASSMVSSPKDSFQVLRATPPMELTAYALTALAFVALFAKPAQLLADAWWNDPNSGHGLLLAPLSFWLAWKAGRHPNAKSQPILGLTIILVAVLFRYAADLAAELFVMRGSMIVASAGLVVWYAGFRQLLHWWLPFTLVSLSVPVPEVILNTVALPLQFLASQIGASLLKWRQIPVLLQGNVIRIPGQELFVAEACSGLRSLTALLSLGVLLGALFLRTLPLRLVLVALTIPIAILVNGFRVFLTGFLVLFVSPEMGQGFMHTSEGMIMFGGAFLITGLVTWSFDVIERRVFTRATEATV